ncbi:MAG TPA: HAMP domain-containing sensor histidine kinase [Actinopolymorphaceae bacterium]|jgi:signal transduction histidine kinase
MYRRIMALTVGLTLIVVLAFAAPLAVLARQVVRTSIVDEEVTNAVGLGDYLSTASFDKSDLAPYVARVADRADGTAAVLLSDGTIVGTAPPGAFDGVKDPDHDGNHDGDDPARGGRLGDVSPATVSDLDGGIAVSVVAMTSSGPAFVCVYVSDDQLTNGVRPWWAAIAGAGILLLALAVVGSRIVTRRLIHPLAATADTARQLATGDQNARAPLDGPAEVATVAAALNQLAERIGELLAAERETAADMSHWLRTPLTALRLDVEALPDSPAARALADDVSNVERTLTAVIHAARRTDREGFVAACDATAVVRERVAFWTPLAEDQGRRVSLTAPARPVQVRTSGDDLASALDALLENVLSHTPEGIAFSVVLADVPDGDGFVSLHVVDEGPGLPDGAHERGRSDRGSSGLGLDIARSCAVAAGGSMQLTSDPGAGTRVRLLLGAARTRTDLRAAPG